MLIKDNHCHSCLSIFDVCNNKQDLIWSIKKLIVIRNLEIHEPMCWTAQVSTISRERKFFLGYNSKHKKYNINKNNLWSPLRNCDQPKLGNMLPPWFQRPWVSKLKASLLHCAFACCQISTSQQSRNLHTIEIETASDSLHDVRGWKKKLRTWLIMWKGFDF